MKYYLEFEEPIKIIDEEIHLKESILDKSSEKIVDPIKPMKKPKNEKTSLKNPFINPFINPKVSRQIIIISK